MAEEKKKLKNHHFCEREYIGGSDYCNLILVGCSKIESGLKTYALHFWEDGDYEAYIADKETLIPPHYRLEATFNNWVKIYDDDGKTAKFEGEEINFYRAGSFGCIIQVI